MSQHDFEQAIVGSRDVLYGQAFALTRNADEAEDLVQETTLRALRGFESFRADGPVRAWMLTILRNQFINGYRARARAPRAVSLDALENPDPVMPTLPGPERTVFSHLENDAVKFAVSQLPEDYRTVLVLSDMNGLTYQEISDELAVPIGTVRSRLSRARGRIRRSLYSWRGD